MLPLLACRSASLYKISLKLDIRSMSYGQKKRLSRWQPPSILIFGYVTVIGFIICCSVPNFIKIGQFLTVIWRFNDFKNGGRPPSWIWKFFSFCHVVFIGMPFCFLIQNFAETDNRSMSYGYKSDFQDGGGRHLEFQKFQFLVT